MRRSGSGRVARRIGAYDEESPESGNSSQSEAHSRPRKSHRESLLQPLVSDMRRRPVLIHSVEPVVKRPVLRKSKKTSSLRMSFGPSESDANDGDESSDAAVVTPKKSHPFPLRPKAIL